jgi:hypothetical protein
MATVNNATGVYATLDYNFDDPNGYVMNLSANSVAHLNAMPSFIQSWQAQDIANNDVGGYFKNPTSANVNIIITLSQAIYDVANSANLTAITTAASTLHTDSNSFLAHTNRLSGVTPFTGDDTVPYYTSAMNLGKTALYITNQTDSISNTSPIMGSFTSILVDPQIGEYGNTLVSYPDLINNSLNSETTTDEGGNTIVIITSNLASSTLEQIASDLANTDTFLTTRQNGDVTYFTNLKTFVNNYNQVKQFSNLGETQSYLLNNFIGSNKLISRINS